MSAVATPYIGRMNHTDARMSWYAPTAGSLMQAFHNGDCISLLDNRTGEYITGRVWGIRLESGYFPGQAPKLFLVDLMDDYHHKVIKDIFVRCVS